jgi:hypothetical protein
MTLMTHWKVGDGTLFFRVPTRAMLHHCAARDTDEDERPWHPSLGNGDASSPSFQSPGTRWDGYNFYPVVEHRIWWWELHECAGGEHCLCGPVTLLEALERLDAQDRGLAVRIHAEEMRDLYDHFWSGQGFVSGATANIGDACVSCIAEGAPHVWDVYEDACILAEEFGEALAAYAYELMVGEPRFRPLNGNGPFCTGLG